MRGNLFKIKPISPFPGLIRGLYHNGKVDGNVDMRDGSDRFLLQECKLDDSLVKFERLGAPLCHDGVPYTMECSFRSRLSVWQNPFKR